MKKERIVALCICAVFLGILYAQWIACILRLALPSTTPPAIQMSYRREYAGKLLVMAWPPFGFLYRGSQWSLQRPEKQSGRCDQAASNKMRHRY